MKQIIKKKNEQLVMADGSFLFCDSRMVADKFGVKHARVIRTIERNKGRMGLRNDLKQIGIWRIYG